MFLDALLKLLGENPESFSDVVDKQAIILEHGLNIFTYILPLLFLLIPVYCFFKKRTSERRKTKNIVIFLLGCVCAIVLGIIIPELIKNMLMGFAVTSLYGGQI